MSDKESEPRPLIFHWPLPSGEGRGLWKWLLVALGSLTVFFLIFRVTYPESQRFTPSPHQVVLLNHGDPAAEKALNRMHDQDFTVLPVPSEMDARVTLEAHSPAYTPGFEGHGIQLQDLPQKAFHVPSARLLNPDEPVLPELDLKPLKAAPKAPTSSRQSRESPKLALRLTRGLTGRSPVKPLDLSQIDIADPENLRFQLSLSPAGQVLFVLPISSSESTTVNEALTRKIEQMRFSPSEGVETGNGEAILVWSSGT